MPRRRKNKKKEEKKKSFLDLHPQTKKGVLAIIAFVLAAISVLSLFGLAGQAGESLKKGLAFLFGSGIWLVPVVFLIAMFAFFKSASRAVCLGLVLLALSILGLLTLFEAGGGYLGFGFSYLPLTYLGFWATLIIFIALFLISILITFNLKIRWRRRERRGGVTPPVQVEEEAKEAREAEEAPKPKLGLLKKRILPKLDFRIKGIDESRGRVHPAPTGPGAFKSPPLDLLEDEKGRPNSGDIKKNTRIIAQTLTNFGIEVEMADVNVGPTVTQYTLRPSMGIKLARITALQNDLALALAAHPLRIEAPIPGKSLVGIEVPNQKKALVRLKPLIMNIAEQGSPLAISLGRDVTGLPIYATLERMPHLLVAGSTGTGKTILLNSLIISLLYQNSADDLKLILIDPKRVELTAYEGLPHLLTPVITDHQKTINALKWAVEEMERRFSLFQEAGTRDIYLYRQNQSMPFIIIIIDELADLMAAHGRDVEAAIVRLAQMARAVGLHLVVSTQRPSVEVITGLIKANITSRVAFQVASQVDSRTILDLAGAEKLLGNGDMLYLSSDQAKPRRIQGAFVSEKEVKRVANWLAKEVGTIHELSKEQEPKEDNVGAGGFSAAPKQIDDTLYQQAKQLAIETGRASASLFQRRLRIGYARAARLLDILEEQGVIGPAEGSKPREVLVGKDALI